MVATLVPMTATPLSEGTLAAQFALGYRIATDRESLPSRKLMENALAIIGVENGDGRAIQNYNWGNISCTPATWSAGMWMHPQPQPGQPLFFRAYSSHDQGSSAWWRLMLGNTEHRKALLWAARGRPDLMVHALYESHYVVGGSERDYQRAAIALANSYRLHGYFRQAVPAFSGERFADGWIAPTAAAGGVAGILIARFWHGSS
jgi:hypothetical protein